MIIVLAKQRDFFWLKIVFYYVLVVDSLKKYKMISKIGASEASEENFF